MLILLFLAQSTDARWDPMTVHQTAWLKCAVTEAEKLEPSREPARDIADAAMSRCGKLDSETTRVAKSLMTKYFPLAPSDDFDAQMAVHRSIIRNAALERVITIRARRNGER